jgi:hypothetical protein
MLFHPLPSPRSGTGMPFLPASFTRSIWRHPGTVQYLSEDLPSAAPPYSMNPNILAGNLAFL